MNVILSNAKNLNKRSSSATSLKGRWARVPASSYNNKIHTLTCKGKMKDGCFAMQKKEITCDP